MAEVQGGRPDRPEPQVALLDYGAGNLHSLKKGLERGGARVRITPDWDEALGLDALVLPGVGSFGAAVRALRGHEDDVRRALEDGLPCLGICLGMQLFFAESEEGEGAGIGLVPGRVRKLRGRRIPQMGWNDVTPEDDPVFEGTEGPDGLVAYYAHSYVCDAAQAPESVIAWSTYEEERFAAGVRRGRTVGVQFHPEKSSASGLRLLENFLDEVAR